MNSSLTRRCFLKTATVTAASLGMWKALAEALAQTSAPSARSKVRVGKIYLGNARPGWPTSSVDLLAEVKRFESELAKLSAPLADVEFIDGGLIGNAAQLAQAKEKFRHVDGILALHISMGVGGHIKSLLELNVPLVLFAPPYSGHEWHTVAGLQREGKLIEVLPSSDYADLAVAVRPFRALHRLKEAKVLHISQREADPVYVKALKEKFGTEIKSIFLPDLEAAYKKADEAAAKADAERWIREARKVVEPTPEEVLKASRMYLAMKNLLHEHGAVAVTMNCLGMGLMDRGMGYPCLGFVRLNNAGLGGICEADVKSTMTHLIFSYLVGKPGFVTDPVFDLPNSAIIHAHCVAATQMLGPNTPQSPYNIRTHLEDGRGASLQVSLPIGHKVSMARLIGTDFMLFSTGDAVDSPLVEQGCRTKLTMRVENIDRFLENWSCGLHRVVFYGDHTRDLRRFCRFKQIRLLREGVDDLQHVPGLEWETYVHA